MTIMKRFRVGYYLLMSILLILGLGTGRWELYFMLSVMVLIAVTSLILNLWVYFSFSYQQDLSISRVVKGDTPILKIRIFNKKPFPFIRMCVEVETPKPPNRTRLCFNIDPGSDYTHELELLCEYRGKYMVGMSILETGDVFGILSMRFDLRRLPFYRHEQLTIYPKLIKLTAPSTRMRGMTNYQGMGAQLPSDDGESFYDTRKYHYGDSFKRIHRKISARRRQLFVKRYDMSMAASVIIMVDTCISSFEVEDSLRYSDIACECAAAIAHLCLRNGNMVALATSDEDGQVIESVNTNDFSRLYDYLATMKFKMAGDMVQALRISCKMYPDINTAYAISSRDDESLATVLEELVQSGSNVKLVIPTLQTNLNNEHNGDAATNLTVTHVTGAHDLTAIWDH